MGYGFGAFLLVVGLVLALAVTDQVSGVDLTMVGWIMAARRGAGHRADRRDPQPRTRHPQRRDHDPHRRHPDRQRAAYRDLTC